MEEIAQQLRRRCAWLAFEEQREYKVGAWWQLEGGGEGGVYAAPCALVVAIQQRSPVCFPGHVWVQRHCLVLQNDLCNVHPLFVQQQQTGSTVGQTPAQPGPTPAPTCNTHRSVPRPSTSWAAPGRCRPPRREWGRATAQTPSAWASCKTTPPPASLRRGPRQWQSRVRPQQAAGCETTTILMRKVRAKCHQEGAACRGKPSHGKMGLPCIGLRRVLRAPNLLIITQQAQPLLGKKDQENRP